MSRSVFAPAVFYKDPIAALRWLERVFQFEIAALVTDADGKLAHSEVTFQGGSLSVGGEWEGADLVGPARMRSPLTVDGVNTQFVRVRLEQGLDEHYAHAKAAGAQITEAPTDQFYGSRTYRVLDLEGHVWNFSQDVRVVTGEEMEKATGLKIHTSLAEV